jgi:NAD(P)H dehydrogenase (quinone)
VQRAYFCCPISPGLVQATAQLAQAAREGGVEVIVNMSQISARGGREKRSRPSALAKRACIRLVGNSGGPPQADVLCQMLLYLAPMMRQGKILAPFTRTGRHAPVAAEDQARVIVAILRNPTAHVGKTYPLFGP